jgi:hypothetical protein
LTQFERARFYIPGTCVPGRGKIVFLSGSRFVIVVVVVFCGVTVTVVTCVAEVPFSPVQVRVKTVVVVKGPDASAHAFVGTEPLSSVAGVEEIVHADTCSADQPTETLVPLGTIALPVEPFTRKLMLGLTTGAGTVSGVGVVTVPFCPVAPVSPLVGVGD